MKSIIQSWYSGKNAKDYDNRRSTNPKWQFEESTVDKFLESHVLQQYRLLDAPVGTGRFCDMYAQKAAIASVQGLDFSKDMLEQCRERKIEKLELKQHDLIRNPAPDHADVVICFRFLNLLPTEDALRVIKNVLPVVGQGGLLSIRVVDDEYHGPVIIDNKIHLHTESRIQELISDLGFKIATKHFFENDPKPGSYFIYEIQRS